MTKQGITCNYCNAHIEPAAIEVMDAVIAQDDNGDDVIERYFDCPHCGSHYTVTIMDREMRLMAQKRKQIQKRIGRLGNCNKALIDKYVEQDRELKEEFMYRASVLKEKYGTEEE